MIDAAIHMIAAVERKYAFLLRLAKERCLQAAPPKAGEPAPPAG